MVIDIPKRLWINAFLKQNKNENYDVACQADDIVYASNVNGI